MEEQHSQTQERIDILPLVRNFFRVLRKTFPWVILLALALGGYRYYTARKNYTPMYTATASFSVTSSYVSSMDIVSTTRYYDSQAMLQVVETFQTIISSSAMQERVRRDLGAGWVPASIQATAVGETNLFEMTSTSSSPQGARDVLNSVIKNYPEVAAYVIGGAKLSMIEEPEIPTEPINSFQPGSTVIKGAISGFLMGLLLTFLLSLLRKTVQSGKDLKRLTGVKELGTVPLIHAKQRRKATGNSVSVLNENLGDTLETAFGVVQSRILRYREVSDGAQVILVTSTSPGEGKTTVSFNLAASIAQRGKRVILVDGDLRHQVIKKRFGIKAPSAGLLELSRATKPDVSRVLIPVPKSDLMLLAGDNQLASPLTILDSPKMRGILQQVRQLADVVIIDAPPAGLLADASILARSADQIVYVVRYDTVPRSQVVDTMNHLGTEDLKVTGFVMNCMPVSKQRYGYGYGYGSYGYGKYGYGKYGYGTRSERKKSKS